ncbi:manganese-dependent inorganic pyrophosphatase [Rhodobacteraceae bacterium 2376]|uniref:inorganic diphosphatase n=1 Tax=Rhabdonatronobacter sediminivivens TaxID=2743469 RepID=A0A7Z0I0I7_9RHOB|nr:manganese-dependent inorganic pyrophosphatase [Rhabdonatronobacter sediminivivens]NYS25668.1 manganese-dependent inorganic pyrophosphatase [Rhabdonatronobacter sediminivivens]
MTVLVFGHKNPDTDSTGSPLIWAWYLSEIAATPARAVLLGEPSAEAKFVLDHWGVDQPEIISDVEPGTQVVIVDTNNPAELPASVNKAEIRAIIDHHKLTGGLQTVAPIDITMRPLACTATIMHDLMGDDAGRMPRAIKGLMLSCILSDTLEFRSPTTTDHDRQLAEGLARDLGLDLSAYAAEMFAAKSDVSGLSDEDLLRVDAKSFDVGGLTLRVSVLETTAAAPVVARKAGIMEAMARVAADDGADEVLLFVVDILNEEATLLLPNDRVRSIAAKSFGIAPEGDTAVLPGVMSRKKQIIPFLKV